MTADDTRIGPIFAGSLLIHAVLLAVALVLPSGGGPAQFVPAYVVQIVEAPQIPQARALSLEAPSLTSNAPPLPTAPAPDVTGLDAPRLPSAVTPVPAAPTAPRASALAEPVPGKPLPAPPALPVPPSAANPRTAPNPSRTATSGLPASPALPAAPALPEGPSLEERLRAKVQSLRLQVESAEPPAARQPSAEGEKSIVSLRLFQNTVRERVKKNYTFPGTFADNLRARVRVIIERSGKLRTAEITESSGDGRFDNLVCLAAIRNAKYPPLPEGVEGDTHTLFLTCSP